MSMIKRKNTEISLSNINKKEKVNMKLTLEKFVKFNRDNRDNRDTRIKEFKDYVLSTYGNVCIKNIPGFINEVRNLYVDTPFFSMDEAVRYEFLYYLDEAIIDDNHPVFDLRVYDFLEYVEDERNFELWDGEIEAMYDDICDEAKFNEILS